MSRRLAWMAASTSGAIGMALRTWPRAPASGSVVRVDVDGAAEVGEIRAVVVGETRAFGVGDAAGDVQRQTRARARARSIARRDVRVQIDRVEPHAVRSAGHAQRHAAHRSPRTADSFADPPLRAAPCAARDRGLGRRSGRASIEPCRCELLQRRERRVDRVSRFDLGVGAVSARLIQAPRPPRRCRSSGPRRTPSRRGIASRARIRASGAFRAPRRADRPTMPRKCAIRASLRPRSRSALCDSTAANAISRARASSESASTRRTPSRSAPVRSAEAS